MYFSIYVSVRQSVCLSIRFVYVIVSQVFCRAFYIFGLVDRFQFAFAILWCHFWIHRSSWYFFHIVDFFLSLINIQQLKVLIKIVSLLVDNNNLTLISHVCSLRKKKRNVWFYMIPSLFLCYTDSCPLRKGSSRKLWLFFTKILQALLLYACVFFFIFSAQLI